MPELVEVLRTPVPGAEPQGMRLAWLKLMAAYPPAGHAGGAGPTEVTDATGVVGTSVSPTRLAVLAGWRHGAVRLRDAALDILASCPDAVCPALGAGRCSAAELAVRACTERWWWPGATRPGRHVVGGFRGDGGSWLERPRLHGADNQAWYVVADGLLWAMRSSPTSTAPPSCRPVLPPRGRRRRQRTCRPRLRGPQRRAAQLPPSRQGTAMTSIHLDYAQAVVEAWPAAQAVWSPSTRLHAPTVHGASDPPEAGAGASGSALAWLNLATMSVHLDTRVMAALGLGPQDCLAVLAHEVGHHVLAPGDRTTAARVAARVRRALIDRDELVPYVSNLWFDFVINDELAHRRDIDVTRVLAPDGPRRRVDTVFATYLRCLELLGRRQPGSLVEPGQAAESEVRVMARVARVYSRRLVKGAEGFAALIRPCSLPRMAPSPPRPTRVSWGSGACPTDWSGTPP